MEQLRALLD